MTGAALLVVAKVPVPGEVKTRLTPTLTEHQAAAIAMAAFLDTLDTVEEAAARTGARAVVALAGEVRRAPAADTLRRRLADITVVGQRGDGFAERLVAAHVDGAGADGTCVQLAMDTPQVSVDTLVAIVEQVSAPDPVPVVLGPATDGGWWSLGLLRAADARHLRGVEMSQPTTGRATVRAFEQAGLPVVFAPELSDVDTVTDLESVAAAIPDSRFASLVRTMLGDEEAR